MEQAGNGTPGGAAPSDGQTPMERAGNHGTPGGTAPSDAKPKKPISPTRRRANSFVKSAQKLAGGEGGYVGTCLVQVPDADGRWQPVKLTASMAGSPVGSINPSLAPSESTIGGRSLRMLRGVGAESIPEDYEWEENEPGA